MPHISAYMSRHNAYMSAYMSHNNVLYLSIYDKSIFHIVFHYCKEKVKRKQFYYNVFFLNIKDIINYSFYYNVFFLNIKDIINYSESNDLYKSQLTFQITSIYCQITFHYSQYHFSISKTKNELHSTVLFT